MACRSPPESTAVVPAHKETALLTAAKEVLRKGMIQSTNSAEFGDMGRLSAFNLCTSGEEQVNVWGLCRGSSEH